MASIRLSTAFRRMVVTAFPKSSTDSYILTAPFLGQLSIVLKVELQQSVHFSQSRYLLSLRM